MANAPGLAQMIAEVPSRQYDFSAFTSGSSNLGDDAVSGTWSRSSNTVTWGGNNPAIEAAAAGTASWLQVWIFGHGTVANIPHSATTLGVGDTITYTTISFNLETDNIS